MALQHEKIYTIEHIYTLPEGQRAELISGQMHMMAPPTRVHQKLISELTQHIGRYIKTKGRKCEIYPAPFAVFLNADEETYVEPDISVICDKSKLNDHGCAGAPDFVIEVVSPSSRRMDYSTKMILYLNSGVREYWIVDPEKKRTTIYCFEEDAAPMIFPFDDKITSGIYEDLTVRIAEMLN